MKTINSAFYSADILDFLAASANDILAEMVRTNSFELNDLQRDSWIEEISILKDQLSFCRDGRIIFEYTIPRMGRRVDVILLYNGIVFLMEFKVGSKTVNKAALDQVLDYALDLKNFHKESFLRVIVPIAIATDADYFPIALRIYEDHIVHPIGTNRENIGNIVRAVSNRYKSNDFNYSQWETSEYYPTPTIIEAAQILYNKHNVKDITRNDAEDLTSTTDAVKTIITKSKTQHRKSIIFVTGVPGAGKTLVGLNLASELHNSSEDMHAVFLSGNHPLVRVLQEALVRDMVSRNNDLGIKIRKNDAKRQVTSFIQMIYHYRDYYFGNDIIPHERIAIFDESQRAWTHEEMVSFMRKNNKIKDSELYKRDLMFSEPGFLISTMNRHSDWSVIVCLVGGGQEINRGEAGIPEWFNSIKKSFTDWDVYCTESILENEYIRDTTWAELTDGLSVFRNEHLHLATSMRSFRSELVSDFVKALLDSKAETAAELLKKVFPTYPIFITRNLETAKDWVRSKSRGSERYGLLASSSASRLKPVGVVYAKDRNSISPENWFLNGKNDLRSSYYLEAVASEFETQGLEIDYAIVSWDADLRIENGKWSHYQISTRLSPPNWSRIKNLEKAVFLTNAYRVLLTRARQGFVIFIPEGDAEDITRNPDYYNQTYNYFKMIGIPEK